jgi:hypothetical protein
VPCIPRGLSGTRSASDYTIRLDPAHESARLAVPSYLEVLARLEQVSGRYSVYLLDKSTKTDT